MRKRFRNFNERCLGRGGPARSANLASAAVLVPALLLASCGSAATDQQPAPSPATQSSAAQSPATQSGSPKTGSSQSGSTQTIGGVVCRPEPGSRPSRR